MQLPPRAFLIERFVIQLIYLQVVDFFLFLSLIVVEVQEQLVLFDYILFVIDLIELEQLNIPLEESEIKIRNKYLNK